MTDVPQAPSLSELGQLFLLVASRAPIQLRVLFVLVTLVIAILVIDGIRANLGRTRRRSLRIVRKALEPSRMASPVSRSAQRPLRMFKASRTQGKLSPFKPPRPSINRLPGGNSGNSTGYQLQHNTREDVEAAL